MWGSKRTRLVLIFALDLKDIEEVGGGGVYLDEVFVVFGDGIGEVCDFELAGALGKFSDSWEASRRRGVP